MPRRAARTLGASAAAECDDPVVDSDTRVCPFCGEPPTLAGDPADAVAEFVEAMRAAGNPGAARTPMSKPGRFGTTRHVVGWVVRPVVRDERDEAGGYEAGLFLTTEGRLHRLESASRGAGQRDVPRYVDTVGPELDRPPSADRLPRELAALLRDLGVDSEPTGRR